MRVVLFGYGLAGSSFHAPFIEAVEGLELRAVVTGDPERQDRVRAAYWSAEPLASPEQVWDRRGDFELAVIATPNRTHVPLAHAALAAGLSVVVDKPFAPSVAQARELASAAARERRVLTVFQNRRFDGDFLTLQRLLAEGALGRVHRFESRFERWKPEVGGGARESPAPEDAGGALFDLGSHLIDQALVLFGRVRTVYAELDARRTGAQVDDDCFLALAHGSGVRSQLWMGSAAAQAGPRFRVMGDRAAYVKYGMDVQEQALRAGEQPGGPGWGEEPEERWGTLGVDGATERVRTEAGSYQRFYEQVASGTVPVDPEDAVRGLEVIEAARRSSSERRVVEI